MEKDKEQLTIYESWEKSDQHAMGFILTIKVVKGNFKNFNLK